MLTVTPVRAFRDNYIWLIHGQAQPDRVAVVDPGDAGPVLALVEAEDLRIEAILVTHHHPDHTGGIRELLERAPVPVWGPSSERIPGLSAPVAGGDRIEVQGMDLRFRVLDVPGHTAGHIAYYGHGALFCGDTLFSAGCGRLFEGTPAQMLSSLDSLAALPDATRIFCAHEYTLANLRFARAVEPDNPAVAAYMEEARQRREDDEPTVPSTLAREKEINPFLRCDRPAVREAAARHAGRSLASRTDVFAAVRRWKDEFA